MTDCTEGKSEVLASAIVGESNEFESITVVKTLKPVEEEASKSVSRKGEALQAV